MRVAKALNIRSYTVERGFTLLEMILVLVIAATVAAVAVPNFQPALANMQLRAATRDVASALRHVRGQALSRGREAVFSLNVDRHTYQVSGRRKDYALPASVRLGLFTAEAELSGEGQGSIRFYPDGSSTGGRVSLEAAGKKRLVDVNWLTGAVLIREENF
jgi:general secretion pathway protein H